MANGGTLLETFGGGRVKAGILVVMMTTLASGMGWFFKQESATYTDRAIAEALKERVVPRFQSRAEFTDFRYQGLNERLNKVEAQAAANGEQFRDVWAAIAARVDRQALLDSQADEIRRLDTLERNQAEMRRDFYGQRK